MSRIVQVANFVTPTSGGLRTALAHLAAGYAAEGHEVVQVLPGAHDHVVAEPWGRRVVLRSPLVPGSGYRVLGCGRRLQTTLGLLAPDVLEVHDRTTLRGLGPWARRRGLPALVVSHERLDRWLQQWLPRSLPLASWADRSNAALAAGFGTVVCTTAWAAQEFARLPVGNLRTVPLGVDLAQFVPRLYGTGRDEVRLVMASRLSREKRPDLALAALRELRRRRLPVRLVVAGDGPLRRPLERAARDLPVEWRGFVSDRAELADLMAGADVVLAPGPVETFGLAGLEALACGTPVVANRNSALGEVVGDVAGRSAPSSGFCFAEAVLDLLTVDEPVRRHAARSRAEVFSWATTVQGFLDVHGLRRVRLAS